ncbi:hypothetical protein LIER_00868 [Lithospermum erythrorhizon]|uniref:Zinc finger PHD-type domain-containing protein n=1 Tax=Lithospermum erythrorhizon TaxID=34254 RepID=A0AAV3NK49_LITER
MESITHFSHEHPLILLKLLPTDETKRICYGCQQPLIPEGKYDIDVYGCKSCTKFFLHKSCAQLPMEIVLKSHEQHSLFLLSELPSKYSIGFGCNLCFELLQHGFFYHCYLDDFIMHIKCAFKENAGIISFNKDLTLYHPSHKHYPLTIQPRPSSFLCDACDVEDKDLSYQCTSCHYWIHRRCAMLPSTTNHDVHTHPLSLSFGLPAEYHNFDYFCGMCEQKLHTRQHLWLYHCQLCRYFVHIKCMATNKPQIEVDMKGLIIDDLPHLPMADKSVELIQRFLLRNNSLDNIQQEVAIFSHRHPLIYANEQIIDETEDDEEVLCDACIEPIISRHYHCAECRFFLHTECAMLPHELQHPSHPHPLNLFSNSRFDEVFRCNHCNRNSNGFFFHCTMEGCEFYLDVKCAALPNVLEHESHNHPLFQIISSEIVYCRCCGYYLWETNFFGCKYCNFDLHLHCLMLPKTTKHRFDSKNSLTLRYPPHSYHARPFDCAECEEEINPNYWLYHCEESDLSFHVDCINRSWKKNNSKFGQKIQITSHPHPLKYVYRASVKSPCHGCESKRYIYHSSSFECETCNFHLCRRCVQKVEPLH